MFSRYTFFLLIAAYVVVGYQLFQSESKMNLSFDKASINKITQPAGLVEIAKEKQIENSGNQKESMEIINISIGETLRQEKNGSSVAKSYQEIQKIQLDQNKRKYNIFFKEPLKNYISLLFIGGAGKVKLEETYVQYEDGEIVSAKNLDESYFEEDWYRFESAGKAIQSITFKGRSDSSDGQIALYVQKNIRR